MNTLTFLVLTTAAALFWFAEFAESKHKTLRTLCQEVLDSEQDLEAKATKRNIKYTKPTADTIHDKDDDVTESAYGTEVTVSVRYTLKCYDDKSPAGSAVECKFKRQGSSGYKAISAGGRLECIDARPIKGYCDASGGAVLMEDKSCVEKEAKTASSKSK